MASMAVSMVKHGEARRGWAGKGGGGRLRGRRERRRGVDRGPGDGRARGGHRIACAECLEEGREGLGKHGGKHGEARRG